MDFWVSADWHFGHENIVRGCSKWENKSACRDFDTLEEHDAILVENINKCAKENDVILFMGDFALGGKENVFEFRRRIICKNIYLVLGNHDLHIKKNYNNCQSLFRSVQQRIEKRIGNYNYVGDHYALRTWSNGHNGSIHLYGHSHGTLEEYYTMISVENKQFNINFEQKKYFKCMDVGIDTRKTFDLYHLDEINKIMENRIPLLVDHHINRE